MSKKHQKRPTDRVNNPIFYLCCSVIAADIVFCLLVGTYTSKECDEPKVVVQRAQQALKDGFSHFNIVGNNCEDFANYCKTGQRSMESAQFSEALERVAVARRAMANGYRSPLVYAGCVMGLFTLKDFSNPPVNRIPCSSGSESVRCTCPDEENDSKENTDNDEDDEEREGKNEEIVENTETDTYTNNNKDETNDRHDESRDLDVNSANQQNSGSMLTTNKSGANSSSRKKVHFCIP